MTIPIETSRLWRLTASELAAGFAHGDFTPLDALDACLAQVESWQPALNAMVFLDRDGARRAAEASARRWAHGEPLGLLDGVPVTVKDNLHVAGWPTSWGSRLFDGWVASADELPVARLRAAGAVLLGKTNLPEFAMQGYTSNSRFGTTRNPWDTALTPGGSSGGAAAAVAAGLGPLALATDGGGSIRRPASHCGLVGFKPSAGLVPRGGGLPEIFLDYEVAGCMARSVSDIVRMTDVLAGEALDVPAPGRARILFVPRLGEQPVDAGISASVTGAALKLQALGHEVEEGDGADWMDPVNAVWSQLSNAGLAWMLARAGDWPEFGLPPGARVDLARCGEAARANAAAGESLGATALFDVLARVKELEARLGGIFSRHDFLLTPATAALPWAADEAYPAAINTKPVGPRGHAVFTAFANAAGLPAIALPGAAAGGLPTGIQLVAPRRHDAALLALALQYEAAHPWANRWPG